MQNIRVIARLDIKGPNLVKGVHLEGLRVLGKPEYFSDYYYRSGVDELLYMDVVASLYGRNSLLEIIERTAAVTNIPLTVGGGLRSIEDIKAVLRAGADKVVLNTAAVKNPNFIKDAANRFGSSTIVVAIEAIKQADGQYLAFTDNGREPTGKDAVVWGCQVAQLGAGEIIMTSIDREGTGLGYEHELIRKVSSAVSVPVIACGGAGKLAHIKDVIVEGNADAVALASMLHYECIKGQGNSRIDAVGIGQIKEYLWREGIPCRHESMTQGLARQT